MFERSFPLLSRSLLCVLCLGTLGLSGCASLRPGPVYLDVFDCLIPVPAGYAINTSDSSSTHAYTATARQSSGSDDDLAARANSVWGELNVWPYDGPVSSEHFEVLRSDRRGRLIVEEIRERNPATPRATLILINDGQQKLSLGGQARNLADAMVESCLEQGR